MPHGLLLSYSLLRNMNASHRRSEERGFSAQYAELISYVIVIESADRKCVQLMSFRLVKGQIEKKQPGGHAVMVLASPTGDVVLTIKWLTAGGQTECIKVYGADRMML